VAIALSLVGLLVLGAVGVGIAAAASSKKTRVADTGYDTYPTFSTSSTRFTPSSTTTRTTAGRLTTTTTVRPTTTTPAGPRRVLQTGDNPLFVGDRALPATQCNLPAWRSDPAAAQAFFTQALPCLDAAWRPVMQGANLPFATPKLAFPSGNSWKSPCGSVSGATAAAFYCGADQTLYMPFTGLSTQHYGNRIGVYLEIFAHEYGHHIQSLSGVSEAYWDARYDVDQDSPAGLELSRRSELQADCFAGMFFGAVLGRGTVTRAMFQDAVQDGFRHGDDNGNNTDRDHGSGKQVAAWTQQGGEKNLTYQCNTWKASASSVA
jgi:predicted metalloprotease